jgi:hypothetical protein
MSGVGDETDRPAAFLGLMKSRISWHHFYRYKEISIEKK